MGSARGASRAYAAKAKGNAPAATNPALMQQALGPLVGAATAFVASGAAWVAARRGCLRDRGLAGVAAVVLGVPAAVAVGVGTEASGKLVAVAAGVLLVATVGVVTDAVRTPRGLRALAVVAAAFLLHAAGVRLDTLKLPFSSQFVPLGWSSLPFTMLWLWLAASVFSRAGPIPGVPYGVGAVAGGTLYVVGVMQSAVVGPEARFLALVVCGVSLGALPATVSLGGARGTAGPHALGFLIGALGILGAVKNAAFLVALVPLLLVSVPLLAAGYSVVIPRGGAAEPSRAGLLIRQQPQHLYDVLLAQGYSTAQVLGVLLAASVYVGLAVVLLVALIKLHFLLKLLLVVVLAAGGLAGGYVALRLLPRPRRETPAKVRVLDVGVTPTTMGGALELARQYIREGRPHAIVTSDSASLVRAHDDPEYRRIVNEADLVTADGQGVVWAARLLDAPVYERVAGCDMVAHLCAVAAEEGRSVFLLGSAPGVAEIAGAKLAEQVPGLQVAGIQDGYFGDEDEPGIVARIRELQPAVLFVALGAPRQEQWIHQHLEELGVPVCIGIGGSLDVIAGTVRRAPPWMRRLGLEWLYRVARQPSRLPRLVALPRIIWMTFGELVRGAVVRRQASGARNDAGAGPDN